MAHHGKMVRVSRSAEAIPLLVPNDALRRDEARAGAGPARGRRGAGEQSGSRSVLVATLLLCVSGAVMYAASSSLAAEERADMRARLVQVAIEGKLRHSAAALAGFAQSSDGSIALDELDDDDDDDFL